MRALIMVFICLSIGAVSGWYVSAEWHKHHPKKGVCEWKHIENVKPVTKDDIRVVYWK